MALPNMMAGVGDAEKELIEAIRKKTAAVNEERALIEARNLRKRMRGMSVSDFTEIDRYQASLLEGGGDFSYIPNRLKEKHAAAVQAALGDRPSPIAAAMTRAQEAEAAVREANRQAESDPKGLEKVIGEAKTALAALPVPVVAAVAAIKLFGMSVAESNANIQKGATDIGQGRVRMGQAMRDLGFSPAEQDIIRTKAEFAGFGRNVTLQGVEQFFSSAARGSNVQGFQLKTPETRKQLMDLLEQVKSGKLDIGTASEIAGAGPFPAVSAAMRGVFRTDRGMLSEQAQTTTGTVANITTSAQAASYVQGTRMLTKEAEASANAMGSVPDAVALWVAQRLGLWDSGLRLSTGGKEDPALDALRKIEQKTPGPPPPSTNSGAGNVR